MHGPAAPAPAHRVRAGRPAPICPTHVGPVDALDAHRLARVLVKPRGALLLKSGNDAPAPRPRDSAPARAPRRAAARPRCAAASSRQRSAGCAPALLGGERPARHPHTVGWQLLVRNRRAVHTCSAHFERCWAAFTGSAATSAKKCSFNRPRGAYACRKVNVEGGCERQQTPPGCCVLHLKAPCPRASSRRLFWTGSGTTNQNRGGRQQGGRACRTDAGKTA
jgi:hypothetical protein